MSSAPPSMPDQPLVPGTVPAEITAPGLSEVQRLVNTFVAPSKTFADIRTNANWWGPFLLGTLIFVAFLYTVEKKVGYEGVINYRFAHASFLQKAIERMPPDQRQEMMDKQIRSSHSSLYTSPIFALVFTAIFALLLMATFNLGFDAQIRFKTALAVVFYGWLPRSISALIAIGVMMLGVEPDGFDMENPVATHLGAILGAGTDSRYLYHLLAGVDLFSLWWVFLIGLGFATVAKKKISTQTGVIVVAVWFIVFVLLRVAISPFAG